MGPELAGKNKLSPDGGSFRMQTRFAKFRNVPELLRMWHLSADIKTAADLNLDVPELARRADGKREPETVLVPASPELRRYVEDLGYRADQVRSRLVDPEIDNMLMISGDGRAAALDLRLVEWPTRHSTKVQVAADRIAGIYAQHRDDIYRDTDSDEPEPVRGSLQLVFCDLGTPNPKRDWSVYGELREQLAARGVPTERVRFMHEARTDREKGELFAAARAGHIAVLIGSTERMGVGTNVQRRAVALHHLDCPWRPADLAQRDGRIIRQRNQNAEVQILRYVTEGSFDAYSWQTVARKAEFIGQVMRGRLDTREIEDIGDNALSYAEVKALATGNPLLLEHAQAKNDLTRLERLQRGHDRAQSRLPDLISSARSSLRRLTTQHEAITGALDIRLPTRGDAFTMTIGTRHTSERAEARQLLVHALRQLHDSPDTRYLRTGESATQEDIARLGGLQLDVRIWREMLKPDLQVAVHVHAAC